MNFHRKNTIKMNNLDSIATGRKEVKSTCECHIRTMNTYIIGHYNPSVGIIDLVSHITYVVCVNFTHKWRDPQFKVDSE